jgi:hypothetical protein
MSPVFTRVHWARVRPGNPNTRKGRAYCRPDLRIPVEHVTRVALAVTCKNCLTKLSQSMYFK